jgi:hypothetical protein
MLLVIHLFETDGDVKIWHCVNREDVEKYVKEKNSSPEIMP